MKSRPATGPGQETPEESTSDNTLESTEAGAQNTPVDPATLQKFWSEFTMQVKKQGKDMWFSMLNQEVELMEDGTTIKMVLTNPILVDKVEEFRPELMQCLKEKLQNTNLMLNPVLEQAKASEKAYTDEEKFRKLAEKYPYLLELKNRLGLDFT